MARIGWEIHRFWSLRGHTGEDRRWIERALARPDALPDGARARELYVVSMLSYVRGQMDRTVEAVEESIAAARVAGDSEALATALLGRGLTALSGGGVGAAEKMLSERWQCSASKTTDRAPPSDSSASPKQRWPAATSTGPRRCSPRQRICRVRPEPGSR